MEVNNISAPASASTPPSSPTSVAPLAGSWGSLERISTGSAIGPLQHAFSYLGPESRATTAGASRSFRQLADDERDWAGMAARLGIDLPPKTSATPTKRYIRDTASRHSRVLLAATTAGATAAAELPEAYKRKVGAIAGTLLTLACVAAIAYSNQPYEDYGNALAYSASIVIPPALTTLTYHYKGAEAATSCFAACCALMGGALGLEKEITPFSFLVGSAPAAGLFIIGSAVKQIITNPLPTRLKLLGKAAIAGAGLGLVLYGRKYNSLVFKYDQEMPIMLPVVFHAVGGSALNIMTWIAGSAAGWVASTKWAQGRARRLGEAERASLARRTIPRM